MLDFDLSQDTHDAAQRVGRARALLQRGIRQVAIVRATSAAIAHAPSIDDCASVIERARDALSRFEHTAEHYRTLTGADLFEDALQLTGELPAPSNWQEAALAQLLLCAATRVDLERQREHPSQPAGTHGEPNLYAGAELAGTLEHMSAARAALLEAGALSAEGSRVQYAGSTGWLRVALGTLSDDEVTREAYRREVERAIAPGLGLPH